MEPTSYECEAGTQRHTLSMLTSIVCLPMEMELIVTNRNDQRRTGLHRIHRRPPYRSLTGQV